MDAHRLILVGWVASLLWAGSIFVAPSLLDPGTVRDLDGRANVVDYGPRWSQLAPFPRVVYAFGDLNCHQMESRSWIIGGNQMPVDARMAAGFVAAAMVVPVAFFLPDLPRVRDLAVQVLPSTVRRRLDSPGRRTWAFVTLLFVGLAPALTDVALQFVGYESTNLRRTWTGALLGASIALSAALTLKSLFAPLHGDGPTRADAA